MTTEAGWYHAQGDPPNTVRRWNGEQWIGFPIEQEKPAGTGTIVGIKPFQPIPGQIRLSTFSAAAKITLLLAMAAHGFMAFVVFKNYQVSTGAVGPGHAPPVPISTGFTVVFISCILAGIAFIAWFSAAYRNLSKWHHNKRSPAMAPVVFFVPGIQFRWPWDMMLELVESSARKERQGEISPFGVLGWWGSWILHQTLFGAAVGLKQLIDLGDNGYFLGIAGSLVAIFGMAWAIYLVHAITQAQESRRRPSPAQRSLALQQSQKHALV